MRSLLRTYLVIYHKLDVSEGRGYVESEVGLRNNPPTVNSTMHIYAAPTTTTRLV